MPKNICLKKEHTVRRADVQPPGIAEHPPAHRDESVFWPLWYDLDAACGGNHYASDLSGDVFLHLPKPAAGRMRKP